MYVHFPTREALIAAVTERAMAEVIEAIEAAGPDRGEPAEALRRILTTAWRTLGRFHALVEINTRLPQAELHRRHQAVLAALQPLIERGQRQRSFRADAPAAWHLAMSLALIHAALAELRAGRVPPEQIEAALVATVVGAVAA